MFSSPSLSTLSTERQCRHSHDRRARTGIKVKHHVIRRRGKRFYLFRRATAERGNSSDARFAAQIRVGRSQITANSIGGWCAASRRHINCANPFGYMRRRMLFRRTTDHRRHWEALQCDRAVNDVRQHHLRDARVVVDHLALGEPVAGRAPFADSRATVVDRPPRSRSVQCSRTTSLASLSGRQSPHEGWTKLAVRSSIRRTGLPPTTFGITKWARRVSAGESRFVKGLLSWASGLS